VTRVTAMKFKAFVFDLLTSISMRGARGSIIAGDDGLGRRWRTPWPEPLDTLHDLLASRAVAPNRRSVELK
jgi:hypothetical protein